MRTGMAIRAAAGLLAFLFGPVHAADGAKVTKMPASATIKSFDPRHPPGEMPHLNPNEAAVTESNFACEVQIEVETASSDGVPDKATITGVTATIKLDITEWRPVRVTQKIRAHEDGHRRISETFYEDADKI